MTAPSVVAKWSSWSPRLLSVLRIVAAFLFMQFGTAKIFAFPAAIMPGGGTAPIMSLPGIAGTLETFGGLFLLVGLFTRPVAFVLAGEMHLALSLRRRAGALEPGCQARHLNRSTARSSRARSPTPCGCSPGPPCCRT